MTQSLNNGAIYLANLNPSKGAEPGKVRPVMVLQNDALLMSKHPSTIVIPLTTQLIDNAKPLRIRIKAQHQLSQDSDLILDQIRAIDNRRFIDGPLVECSDALLQEVHRCLAITLGFH